MKLKIIACGVFEDELREVAARCGNELDVELLDAGLHSAPERLRLEAQAAIDLAGREAAGYDAICLAYGLCGRGTAGLVAREAPVVLPRVHDCSALFLGGVRAYREQFARHPGTFYFTTTWYKNKAHPEQRQARAARRFDPERHPHYAEFKARYGEDNARYLVEFFESWRGNYSRAALIDHGFATERHVEAAKAVAEAAGWRYERIEGSLELLEGLVAGEWDEERFIVVPPGSMVITTGDERIFDIAPAVEGGVTPRAEAVGEDQVAEGTFYRGDKTTQPGQGADVALGIDAGGTHTDAVLFEFAAGRLLSKAKAVTTHGDLAVGIAEALERLDSSHFGRVSYACLSTTLATNAIVEGRGRPVGLIVMPFHEDSVRRIDTPLRRAISARMDIAGIEHAPVLREEVLEAARALVREGATSFAVSGYGAVRNPDHEREVKRMLTEELDLPVVCGHELSGRLNFVARAHTAMLNARLVPLIEALLAAVEQVLRGAGIRAPIFVVRGDGAIMNRDLAAARSIETVMSGPAASAAGGRFLTGRADALVVDVGGTTTDIAALREGAPALSRDGARVGRWRTSVTAVNIQTTGLGGDSAARPGARGRPAIGPDRAVPLCYLSSR